MEKNKYLGGIWSDTHYTSSPQKFKDPLKEENKSPSLEDLSPKAIRKELMKKVNSSGITTATYALPILAIFLALALGMSFWNFITLIFGSLALIATVKWVIPYFFLFDGFQKKHTREVRDAIEQRNQEKRMEVKEQLEKLGIQQGADQFNELLGTFNTLIDVLGKKFKVTEMAYMKYYVISQQLLEAAMNNLSGIILIKTNLRSINPLILRKRIKDLQNSEDELDKEEVKTLKERLELYNSDSEKIERLIVQNEQAITQMVKTTQALASIDTIDEGGKLKLDEVMVELRDAVQRLADFNKLQNIEDPLSKTN
jgi:hypothetical protein